MGNSRLSAREYSEKLGIFSKVKNSLCKKMEILNKLFQKVQKNALNALYKLGIISFEDAVPPLLEKLWSWSLAQVTIWQIVAANETCLKPLKNSSLWILMNSRTKGNISKKKYLIRSILYFEDLAYPVGQYWVVLSKSRKFMKQFFPLFFLLKIVYNS